MSVPEPEPFKVIDRRGAPKEPRKPVFPPDHCAAIRSGENQCEFVALFPGNHVREHHFRVNSLENRGMILLSKAGDPSLTEEERRTRERAMEAIPGNRKAMQA